MTDDKITPLGSSPQNLGQSDLEIVTPSREDTESVHEYDSLDPTYVAKEKILNNALREIGMGKYQWHLFLVTGFGWLSDNLWPIVTGLIFTPVINEFTFKGPFLKLGQNIGLLVGAVFSGVGSDIWGRRYYSSASSKISRHEATYSLGCPSFNLTLFITGVFALSVGGNLPVDSAIFLEFIPATHQYPLTVLSVCKGQVAWPLIANFSCPTTSPPSPCPCSKNQGWPYFLYTMGGLMLVLFVIRFFIFHLYKSPKFLMGLVHKVAAYNGTTTAATLRWIGFATLLPESTRDSSSHNTPKNKLPAKYCESLLGPLFKTWKLALSTSLLITLWALIGLAFPLWGNWFIFKYNSGSLTISAALTGVFLFGSTTSRSSATLLGWNCGYSFTSNIMYGVLYAISPELFPAKDRGTGNALVVAANRIFGITAPIITLYTNLATVAYLLSGFIALLLPFEPRGKASL
ncbi:Major facilitator superfamily domain containing protein [Russula decolorans]